MSEEKLESTLIDIGEKFREDIKSGKFDNFLFVTYGVEPGLIKWFPEGSEITIMTRRQEVEEIKNSEYAGRVKTRILDSHAKIYLMWNEAEIKCWIGSFNFTGGGLFSNIEWSTFFKGKLTKPLEIEEGSFPHRPTDNYIINQILDVYKSIRTEKNPQFTDNLFQNSQFPLILLHSNGSNTLKKSLKRIIGGGELKEIVYVTPFFGKEGIMKFIPQTMNPKDVKLKVLTNKPSKSHYDPGNFPKSEKIDELEDKLGEFKLLKRSSKGEGTTLPSGTEIRNEFIHMKLIGLLVEDKNGEEKFHSIFTSANLSKRVWGDNSRGIEVGIWNRDPEDNKKIRLFLENFESCFSEPDDEDLEEIDETLRELEEKKKTEEVWLEDALRDSTIISEDSIKIEKSSLLPEIQNLTCSVFFKDLINGGQKKEEIEFSEKEDCFWGEINLLKERKNLVIDFIKISFDTNLIEPQEKVKEKNIEEYIENIEGLREDWNSIIVNGKTISTSEDSLDIEKSEAENILLRKTGQSTNSKNILIERVEKQPHLKDGFIIDQSTSLETVQGFGKVYEVELATNQALDPPFDTVGFYKNQGKKVDFIGFSKEGNRLYYYFSPAIGENKLSLRIEEPYRRYFRGEAHKIELPRYEGEAGANLESLREMEFEHSLAGEKYDHAPEEFNESNFISEKSSLRIKPPKRGIERFENAEIKYIWREGSLFYKKPEIQPIKQEFKPSNPYSRVYYRGVIQREHKGRTVNFITPKKSFRVRKNLVESLNIEIDNFPNELPLDNLSEGSLLGWLKLEEGDIDYDESAKILREKPTVAVYKNGEKIPNKTFGVLNSGRVIFVPVFLKDLGPRNQFIFAVRFKEDTPFTSNFAWHIKRKIYEITQEGREKIKIKDKKKGSLFPIMDNEEAQEEIGLKFNRELESSTHVGRIS